MEWRLNASEYWTTSFFFSFYNLFGLIVIIYIYLVFYSGTVRRRWKSLILGGQTEIDLVLQANHIEISNDQNNAVHVTNEIKEEFNNFWKQNSQNIFEARNKILTSICPEVNKKLSFISSFVIKIVEGV